VKGYEEGRSPRVLVVGAGTRLLSAMSYYSIRLTNALAGRFVVATIPMRQLIPTFLYPGRSRVGTAITRLEYDPAVTVLKGIDWYWVPNLFSDLNSLRKWRPDVVIFGWWTGTVLHTYLAIAFWLGFSELPSSSSFMKYSIVVSSGSRSREHGCLCWAALLRTSVGLRDPLRR
jgi:hypothetical protein